MRNIITYVDANKQHHTIDDISKIKNISINISGDFNILKIHHCPNFKNCKINISSHFNYIEIRESKCLITFNAEIHGGSYQNLYIGSNFSSGSTSFIMTEPFGDIIINDNCMFSSDILFLNSDSHCIFDNENNLINSASGILIHDHVWISRGAKILKNAEIGANSVVGAYSIVAKKFKHKNIAIAGNPAKEIAANIHWEREALYKYFDRVGIKQGMVEKVKSKIDARNDYFRNILPQHEYEKISENLASYIIK